MIRIRADYNRLGSISEKMSTSSPRHRTTPARFHAPFHSCRTIPQKLLNITLSDIRILHEKASMTGESAKKLYPMPSPKNWEYHKRPAKVQKIRLLPNTPGDTWK